MTREQWGALAGLQAALELAGASGVLLEVGGEIGQEVVESFVDAVRFLSDEELIEDVPDGASEGPDGALEDEAGSGAELSRAEAVQARSAFIIRIREDQNFHGRGRPSTAVEQVAMIRQYDLENPLPG